MAVTEKTPKKPSKKDEVKDILDRTKIEKPQPDQKKPKKKRETRGRPKKLRYSKTGYQDHPLAKSLNTVIVSVLNKTILKDCKDQLKREEIEIGEATTFTLEYYLPLVKEHPLLILAESVGACGIEVYEKHKTKKPAKKEKEPIGTE